MICSINLTISGTNSETRVITSGNSTFNRFISSKNSVSKCLLNYPKVYPFALASRIILSSISVMFMHNYIELTWDKKYLNIVPKEVSHYSLNDIKANICPLLLLKIYITLHGPCVSDRIPWVHTCTR